MARKLLPQEFYKELSKKINCDVDQTQFIWENIVEFLIDEMKMYGEIKCPSFGEFKLTTKGGREVHIPNSPCDKVRLNTTDAFRTQYIDFYQQLKFYPSDSLKNVINNHSDTTAVWKRAREEVRKYQAEQAAIEKEKEILKKKQNAMNIVQAERLRKIQQQKAYQKLSKQKQKEALREKNANKDWEE